MILEQFRDAIIKKRKIEQAWTPDNRATRRRRERWARKFEAQPKIPDDEARFPLAGYKSPHKPREIASRRPK